MPRACLLGLVVAAVPSAEELSPPALNEMVETERAFAAMGAEKGVRESFFEFFGEEGVSFNPDPTKFREYARNNPLPDPPPPRELKLEWWPVYGDVAESGDLGYNTGPTLVTDLTPQNRPSRHGYFFSVWKKQPNGTWRVAVDMGADSPGPDPAHQDRLRYERALQEPAKGIPPRDASQGRQEILDMESRFGETLARLGVRDGYLRVVGEHARLHRVKNSPCWGRRPSTTFSRIGSSPSSTGKASTAASRARASSVTHMVVTSSSTWKTAGTARRRAISPTSGSATRTANGSSSPM